MSMDMMLGLESVAGGVGWGLALFAARASLIMGTAFLAVLALHRASAATRHMVWTTAFAALLLLPLASHFAPNWRVIPAPVIQPVTAPEAPAATHASEAPRASTAPPRGAAIETRSATGSAAMAAMSEEQRKMMLEASGGRDVYEGYIVNDIYCEKDNEYIDFTSKPDTLRLNDAVGHVDDDQYKRLQIRRTITEHLDKELMLRPRGLKVLSLFFIDRVANYRDYDADGVPRPGKYALMFEEEYAEASRKPNYQPLFEGVDPETAADGVHDGYFAVDKRKDASGNERFKAVKANQPKPAAVDCSSSRRLDTNWELRHKLLRMTGPRLLDVS